MKGKFEDNNGVCLVCRDKGDCPLPECKTHDDNYWLDEVKKWQKKLILNVLFVVGMEE